MIIKEQKTPCKQTINDFKKYIQL